jgi:large subunit ribosomal protein L23
MKNPHDIIKTASLTEKSTRLAEQHNQYVFKVDVSATKKDIEHAIKTIFKKDVLSVNTLRVTGKKKRERTVSFGRRPSWKKAIVTLKDGQKIEFV